MKATKRARRVQFTPPGSSRPITAELTPERLTFRPYRCRAGKCAGFTLAELYTLALRFKEGSLWATLEHPSLSPAGHATTARRTGEQPRRRNMQNPNYPTAEQISEAIDRLRRETGEQYVSIYVEVCSPFPGSETIGIRCYVHGHSSHPDLGSLDAAMAAFMEHNSKEAKRREAARLRAKADALEAAAADNGQGTTDH